MSLNGHLYKHDQRVPLDIYRFETASRNKLTVIPEIQERLQNVFCWKALMFEQDHIVRFPSPIVCVEGTGHPILNVNYRWSTEYFHFITEVLPNLLFLNTFYPNAPIFCSESSFTVPMLRWFGVGGTVMNHLPEKTMRVEAPFVECGNTSPYKLGLLREKVCQKLTFEKSLGILIHRQKNRVLLNETEVFTYLRRKFPDVKWVVFDSLSVEDTAKLFAKAAIIFAPHGAGLTNMIFSPPDTRIIECMPIEFPNMCYWNMSQMMKNPYTMIPVHIQNNDWDMRVPMDVLDSILHHTSA